MATATLYATVATGNGGTSSSSSANNGGKVSNTEAEKFLNGGEGSVSYPYKGGYASYIYLYMDASALKDKDITINSVTLSFYAYSESLLHTDVCAKYTAYSGSTVKVSATQTDVFPTVLYESAFKYDLGTWTKDELIAQHSNGVCGPRINLQIVFSTSRITTQTAYLRDIKVIVNYTVNKYTVTANTDGGGTVSGGGTYESGTTATLTATPDDGYEFVSWSDGETQNPRTVNVTADAVYTAIFKAKETAPVFKSVSIYPNPVVANESFIISVEVE